jgi:hypothetical protein
LWNSAELLRPMQEAPFVKVIRYYMLAKDLGHAMGILSLYSLIGEANGLPAGSTARGEGTS